MASRAQETSLNTMNRTVASPQSPEAEDRLSLSFSQPTPPYMPAPDSPTELRTTSSSESVHVLVKDPQQHSPQFRRLDEQTTAADLWPTSNIVLYPKPPLITTNRRSGGRLASSRRLILNHQPSSYSPLPTVLRKSIPGELLEQDLVGYSVAVTSLRASQGNAAHTGMGTESDLEPVKQKNEDVRTHSQRFRRWSHLGSFSARLRRKDARRESTPHTAQPLPPNGTELAMRKPSFEEPRPRLTSTRFSVPFASTLSHLEPDDALSPSRLQRQQLPPCPLSIPHDGAEVSVTDTSQTKIHDPPGIRTDVIPEGQQPRYRACDVCGDRIPEQQFPKTPPSRNCVHEVRTCLPCTLKWIEMSIESKGWDQSKCPECKEVLTYADMKLLATPELFARYVAHLISF